MFHTDEKEKKEKCINQERKRSFGVKIKSKEFKVVKKRKEKKSIIR